MSNARIWIAGTIVAAVGGAVLLTGASGAGENKEIRDGIEQMLLKIGRDAPSAGTLKKDGAAFEQMGFRIAALGMIAGAKGAPKTGAKGTVKDWNGWANDTVAGGIALADAAKAKGGADVKTASSKLNNACNSCHTV